MPNSCNQPNPLKKKKQRHKFKLSISGITTVAIQIFKQSQCWSNFYLEGYIQMHRMLRQSLSTSNSPTTIIDYKRTIYNSIAHKTKFQ